jgi:hypothetical protein
MKLVPPEEFQKFGWLQEVNRLFFHPRGHALAMHFEADGSPTTHNGHLVMDLQDWREPDGIELGPTNTPEEALEREIKRSNLLYLLSGPHSRITQKLRTTSVTTAVEPASYSGNG